MRTTRTFRLMAVGMMLPLIAAEASARPTGKLRRVVCEGEISSGSGMAGTIVGDCSFKADTDPERTAQGACEPGSTCRVDVMVDRDGDVVRVLSAKQVKMAVAKTEPYLERLGGYVDGILAPASAGCDNPQDTQADRVAVLLNGMEGAAVQLHGRYCAITSGTGDAALESSFEAVLRGNCAPAGAADADLRTGRAGTKTEITISKPATGPIRIDGEPLVRCRIRAAYTPRWWIERNYTFRGRYPYP